MFASNDEAGGVSVVNGNVDGTLDELCLLVLSMFENQDCVSSRGDGGESI